MTPNEAKRLLNVIFRYPPRIGAGTNSKPLGELIAGALRQGSSGPYRGWRDTAAYRALRAEVDAWLSTKEHITMSHEIPANRANPEHDIINGFNFADLPFTVDYIGRIMEKEWPHFAWNCTFTYPNGCFTITFKTGIGRINTEARGQAVIERPSKADVMHCLLSDADAGDRSFNDWCDEFGYSNDSISAFKTYQACCETAVNLRKVFTREQIAAMREALQDF